MRLPAHASARCPAQLPYCRAVSDDCTLLATPACRAAAAAARLRLHAPVPPARPRVAAMPASRGERARVPVVHVGLTVLVQRAPGLMRSTAWLCRTTRASASMRADGGAGVVVSGTASHGPESTWHP